MTELGSFPVPKDQVALLDIDGTLIDDRYEITDKRIYSTVQTTQEAGWTIGLSSDSPYEAMTIWRKRVGTNGPIIAERGALVEISDCLMYDSGIAAKFASTKAKIDAYFLDIGVVVQKCNPVEVIRQNNRLGTPGDTVVLINDFRRTSLGLFVRTIDEYGNAFIDKERTEEVIRQARQFYPELEDLEEDLNHDYGLVILGLAKEDKRSGTKSLSAEIGTEELAMVGNSMGDFIGKDIALHYAVANSTPEFKTKANYISWESFTSGVVDILAKLATNTERTESVINR